LIHKAKTEEPRTVLQQLQTGLTDGSDRWVWPVGTRLTGEGHRSDRCATAQFRDFKVEDTHRDRMTCVEAKQGVVAGHPSDGENLKTSKTALEGLVSLVVK
jgi:hypothetical protein